MKAVAGLLLKVLNSSASRNNDDVLLMNLGVPAVRGVDRLGRKPLAQRVGDLCLETCRGDSRLDAAEDIQPVRIELLQNAGLSLDDRLDIQGNPDGGRVGVDAISKETGRRDPDDRDWAPLDVEGGVNYLGFAAMIGLPSR